MISLSALLAALVAAVPALAVGADFGVIVDPSAESAKAAPAIDGLVAARDLTAARDALAVDPGLRAIVLTVAGFEAAPADDLRELYEAGHTVAVIDGQVSLLARALGVATDLPDLHGRRADGPMASIALLMPLTDELGEPAGHHAFTDLVDGPAGVARVVAHVAASERPVPPSPPTKGACSGVPSGSGNTTFTGPAGTTVVGHTTAHCGWDSFNGGYAVFGYGYSTASSHDQLKVTMVTYNNCGWWHQISSTIKTGNPTAVVAWPGLLAGIPSCGNKFLVNTVHSARKGSTWFSGFTSACAGTGC